MRFPFSRRVRLVLFVLMIGLAAVGIAYASIPASSGVIHGCYGKANGQLRVIDTDASGTCTPSEQPLDWNQSGPRGATGERGPSNGFVSANFRLFPTPLPGSFTDIGVRLNLPAGRFIINATVGLDNGGGPSSEVEARCFLSRSNLPLGNSSYQDVEFGDPDTGVDSGTIPLTGAIELDAAGAVTVMCSALPSGVVFTAPSTITAIEVASLADQSLP
jgi:hypothetical protein